MRKILSLLLSLMLILIMVPVCDVSADTTPIITVSDAVTKPGNSVNVQISIANNPGISAMAFSITYNSEVLEYTGYQKGYLTDYTINNHPDIGLLSFVSTEESERNDNDTLFTLAFKIKDNAPNGEYEIGIANSNPEKYGTSLHDSFANLKEQFIVPVVENGTIKVIKEIMGDVNGDAEINSRDASLIMQFINNWDVSINEEMADVYADQKINSRDYILLVRYINNWDVVLGG